MLDAGQPHAVGGEGQTDDQRGEEILEVLSIGLARVELYHLFIFLSSSSVYAIYISPYIYIQYIDRYQCVYTLSLHICTSTHIFIHIHIYIYIYMVSLLSN